MRFRVLLFFVLLPVFALSSPVFAQKISGSILDAADNPVGGAARVFNSFGDVIFDAWTNESGDFETDPLDNGTFYVVTINTVGMLDEAWNNVPCKNLVCTVTGSTPIEVTGGNISNIDFVLAPIVSGGQLSGLVEDSSNVPLADVGVDLLNANGEHLMQFDTFPDGSYQSPLLANDTYYLRTNREPFGLGRELYDDNLCVPANSCDDPAVVIADGTAVVISGSDRPGLDFSLEIPADAMISGQVTDADSGIVLPDIHMNLLNSLNQYIAHTNTDPLGNYYFSGLPNGTYKVYAVGVPEGYSGELYGGDQCHEWSCDLNTSGTPIIISAGADAPGRDIVLDFSGTRLLGTVTRSDGGDPVSSQYGSAGIDLYNVAGEHMGGSPLNRAGQYQIALPGTGNYYLVAWSDWNFHGLVNEAWNNINCYYDCNPVALGANLIPVTEGTTEVADFVLAPGFFLSGTIKTEGSLTGDGAVTIWDDSGQRLMWAGNDGGGNWISALVPAGTYYATVGGEHFGMVSQLYNGISCPQEFCDVTAGTAVVVTDSDIANINFDLAAISADWTISGSIRDAGDNPVHGVVRLFDPFGEHIWDVGADHLANFKTEPLANGIYHMVTLHTHEMLDEAWDNFPCENLLCDITASTQIVVDGANVSGIDFVLGPIASGGRISGRIEDSSTTPLADVAVAIRNRDGHFLFDLWTLADGSYQTPLLADDSYYVHTAHEPYGLGGKLYINYPCFPVNDCGNPSVVIANGTAVVISGVDKPGINFTLEIPAGAMISGQVTDAGIGMVLPDLHVVLFNEFNDQVADTHTDISGNYYFSGLADGSYKVYVDGVPEGYSQELYGGDHCPDWSCDFNTTGTPIVISGGVSVSGRNILLDFNGTRLLGTVTHSPGGVPVSSQYAHAGVDLFNESGDYMGGSPTNRAGQYQIFLPGAGNYYLLAVNDWNYHSLVNEAWDDVKCYYDCNPVSVGADLITVADSTTVVADFVLDPGFELSGTIRAEGALIPDGGVTIWDDTGQQVMWIGNDGSGHWTSPPVPVGTYYATVKGEYFGMASQLYNGMACPQEFCDVTVGTPIVITSSNISGIGFDLAPVSADWTISGSIRDPQGNPVSGSVRIFDPYGGVVGRFWNDELANFQTDPLPDGTYFAITMTTFEMIDEAWQDMPCVNRVCDVTASTPIVVSGGDVSGIDFVINPITVGGRISGIIEDSAHTPLADVGIVFRNSNGAWLFRLTTGPDGTYQSRLLSNDSYFLHTRDEPFGLGRELYDDIPCLPLNNCGSAQDITATATPIVVSGSNEAGIDFTLEVPAGGRISGRIMDFDTAIPLPDVHVTLLDGFNNPIIGTNTDPLGDYYFSGLADDSYKVFAEGVPEGYTQELYDGDHCPDGSCDLNATGTPIIISAGANVPGKDIVLDYSGTRLLGTVTRSDSGASVTSQNAHASVDLFNEAGEFMGQAFTNRAGQYQLNLPGAGNYYLLTATDPDYHGLIDEVWDNIKCYEQCDPSYFGASLISVPQDTTVVADFVLDPEVIFSDGFE